MFCEEKRHCMTSAVVEAWRRRAISVLTTSTHESWRVLTSHELLSFSAPLLCFPQNVPFIGKFHLMCKVSLSSASDIHNLHNANSDLLWMNASTLWQSKIHSQTANTFWHIVSFPITFSEASLNLCPGWWKVLSECLPWNDVSVLLADSCYVCALLKSD